MSRRRAIWLVARREILERGRSRSFLISLGLTIALILAGIFIPGLIGAGNGGPKAANVALVGAPPARFADNLAAAASQSRLSVTLKPVANLAAAEAGIKDDTLAAALEFPSGDASPTVLVKERGNFGRVVRSLGITME